MFYKVDEILWGYEFVNIIDEFRWRFGRYRVDFLVFDDICLVFIFQVLVKDYYEGKMFKMNLELFLLSVGIQEDIDYDLDNMEQRFIDIILSIEDNEVNGDEILVVYV